MFLLPAVRSIARGRSSMRSLTTSQTTTSWEMKHKKTEPKNWTKILPQSLKEKMANKSKPKISVLNLHGMIASSRGQSFGGGRKPLNIQSTEKLIDKAFKDKKLEAVFLSINSPGGSAVQSELIVRSPFFGLEHFFFIISF